MRMFRVLLVSFTLAMGGLLIPPVVAPSVAAAARAGIIMYTHRWWNGQWWTDTWDYEFPGIYTWLGSTPGYW